MNAAMEDASFVSYIFILKININTFIFNPKTAHRNH